MSIEVISGIGIIIIAAIWAAYYIYKRNRENNNEHLFDFIPHLFPTLGIFFTFLGIAIGLWKFDSNNIEKSIPELMNGLKTAFVVSIFGVALLVVFSFVTNIKRKKLEEGVLSEETIAIQKLTEILIELKKDFSSTDENGNIIKPGNVLRDIYEESKKQSRSLQTFSTDLAITISEGFEQILNNPNQGVVAELRLLKSVVENLADKFKENTELIMDFYSTNEDGNIIKPGSVLRDIYEESKKQSKSLQTFSTDLAITISEGFEQILNNPNQGVVAEIKLLNTEIDNLGKKLKDPATDMTQNIVKDLQVSMRNMIEEFKTSMSGDTKNEMERLAGLLGQAGGSLSDFPSKLQVMTENLNENFRGLQNVVKQISQQTLSQSEHSTNEMRKQVVEMSEILKNKVGTLQVGQESLLTKQSQNLQVSDKLLSAFNTSIEKMTGLSNGVTESIRKLNKAQSDLEGVIVTFRNISKDVNSSSSKFGESQLNFSKYSNEFLQRNTSTIQEIQKSLSAAKEVSADYAQKFDIIEKGLQDIFSKINNGLKDYQTTVSQSLETFLGKYTEHLTKTAESLAAASSKQGDILEELTEQLSKLNGRRN